MTMQHPTHPDDERLAALAGGDPEVTSDGALRAHVDSCDRCGALVRELGSLRTALSELPDLVPSRPLQLLPPVAEPRTAGRVSWLRRLAAPAMAAGIMLVIAGAVGSSGFTLNIGLGTSAGASMAEAGGGEFEAPAASQGDNGGTVTDGFGASPQTAFESADGLLGGQTAPPSTATRGHGGSDEESSTSPQAEPAVPPADGGSSLGLFEASDPRLPWLIVLALGVGLLFAGIYLRFAQRPRAG